MYSAVSVRPARLSVDEVAIDSELARLTIQPHGMRARFAARFGGKEDASDDGSGGVTRSGQLRSAFNSPFWPFVLATTSVGQEGLDFHQYCHAVVHWNLPSNPVDLEQREGRVHRYKNHAVRRNLAMRHGHEAISAEDPWVRMFELGAADRQASDSEIIPYWIYAVDRGPRIERHVPSLPLSRDVGRMEALRRSLAVYRMAFGQSRQDDLVAYLLEHLPRDDIERLLGEVRVDLSPRGLKQVQTPGASRRRGTDLRTHAFLGRA